MRKINKAGKGNGAMTALLAILIIGLLGVAYFAVSQNVGGKADVTSATGCSDSTGKLTVNSYSALSKSSNVTPTLTVGVNGAPVTTTATSGTSTFAVGDKLQIVAVLSDYIDTELTGTMTCGGLTLDNPMYYSTSDNPAIRVKNDDGDYVTGTTVNQTNVNAGETIRLNMVFDGTSLESSGDGILVVEAPASSSANISSIDMSGVSKTNVPQVHSLANAGSKSQAFDIPAIVGSDSKEYGLQVVLGASKDLSGTILYTFYSKQKFVETDGTVGYGVENKDGTLKYENTVSGTVIVNSA